MIISDIVARIILKPLGCLSVSLLRCHWRYCLNLSYEERTSTLMTEKINKKTITISSSLIFLAIISVVV